MTRPMQTFYGLIYCSSHSLDNESVCKPKPGFLQEFSKIVKLGIDISHLAFIVLKYAY